MVTTLYIDRTNNKLVKSSTDATQATTPAFFYRTKISFKVYILDPNPTGGITAPYSIATITGKYLRLGIGEVPGVNTPVASQSTFSNSNTYFTGTLDLTSTTVRDYVGTEAEKSTWFEVQISDDNINWDVILQISAKCKGVLFES